MEDFRLGDTQIVVGTDCFTWGVDFPDIRNIVVFGLPSSFSKLVQQLGGQARMDNKPMQSPMLPGGLRMFQMVHTKAQSEKPLTQSEGMPSPWFSNIGSTPHLTLALGLSSVTILANVPPNPKTAAFTITGTCKIWNLEHLEFNSSPPQHKGPNC